MSLYIGAEGKARSVKGIYVGVNGLARKAVRGYVGDENGRARLFYAASNLPPIGASLDDCTWEQIQAVSQAGLAPDYWAVGDTKTISYGGVSTQVRIIGYAHDYTDSARTQTAGITFDMAATTQTGLGAGVTSFSTSSAIYTSSALYTYINGTCLSTLPSDLRAVLAEVYKPCRTSIYADTLSWQKLRLFALSDKELGSGGSSAVEGAQYAYYSTAARRKKTYLNGTSGSYYWTRSCQKNSSGVYRVDPYNGSLVTAEPTQTSAAHFAFCV